MTDLPLGLPPPGKSIDPDSLRLRVFGALSRLPSRLPNRAQALIGKHLLRKEWPDAALAARTQAQREAIAGVPAVWLFPEAAAQGGVTVLLHGGGYTGGPTRSEWQWAAAVAQGSGTALVLLLYGLPPDRPFPAGLDDAVRAIEAMQDAGVLQAGRWALAGNSSGGGLALAAATQLVARGHADMATLVLTAPWADITMQNPSLAASERADPILSRRSVRPSAEIYADGHALDDPRLSPINGELAGLPPVHLNVGARDLLAPDVRRLRDRLTQAGVTVAYVEQPNGLHTYPLFTDTPEAQRTIALQAHWLRERLATATPPACQAG